MKKISTTFLIFLLLLFFIIQILTQSKVILNAVTMAFDLWKNNLVPSMFPFFLLSEFLIYFGFVEFFSACFGPFLNRIFKISKNCSFIVLMSMVSGFPSNAKYTKECLDKNLIDEKDANKVLLFSHFSNPLFILGTVSLLFLKNKEVGFLILFCHYIGNLFIGLLFRNYLPKECKEKTSFKKALKQMHKKRISQQTNFGIFFTQAIVKTIQTLLIILGVVTTFLILTSIFDQHIQLNSYHQSILNGFLEMTQGLKYVSILQIPLRLKCTLTVMILSFGGFSVHMQMFSFLDSKVRYFPFLTARIGHALFSSVLIYSIFPFFF